MTWGPECTTLAKGGAADISNLDFVNLLIKS